MRAFHRRLSGLPEPSGRHVGARPTQHRSHTAESAALPAGATSPPKRAAARAVKQRNRHESRAAHLIADRATRCALLPDLGARASSTQTHERKRQ